MKKLIIKWSVGVLLAPIILFFILTIALYIPKVQNFAVGKATGIISKTLGMDVKIEELRLTFLLDINLKNVAVTDSVGQRILEVENLDIDLGFRKLLFGEIDVEGIQLNNATADTQALIPGIGIKGHINSFFIDSHGVSLPQSKIIINNANLSGADIQVALKPTEPEDTTTSATDWAIALQKVSLTDSRLKLSLQDDSMQIAANVQALSLVDGYLDLGKSAYSIMRADLNADSIRYDMVYQPITAGLDPNHIHLSGIEAGLDSIHFNGQTLDALLLLKHFKFKEKCGIEVTEAEAKVLMDSISIQIPEFIINTAASHVAAKGYFDFAAISSPSDGSFNAELLGEIGKKDITLFTTALPHEFIRLYPDAPITIAINANGNIDSLELNKAEVALADAFKIKAVGDATLLTDPVKRNANVRITADTKNLDFIKPLLEDSVSGKFAIPPMSIDGSLSMKGTLYDTDIRLQESNGHILAKASLDTEGLKYNMALDIDSLLLSNFLPKDSLRYVSFSANGEGRGIDVFDKQTKLHLTAELMDLGYGKNDRYNFGGIKLKGDIDKGIGQMDIDSDNPILNLKSRFDALLNKKNTNITFSVDMRQIDFYALNITPEPFKMGMCLHVDGSTNLKDAHKVNGEINDIVLVAKDTIFRPKDLAMNVLAYPDTTYADIHAGDFMLNLDGQDGYMDLLENSQNFITTANQQLQRRYLDQDSLRLLLPRLALNVSSGKDNPIAYYLRTQGYDFREFDLDVSANPSSGLNGNGHIYDINANGIVLDTIQLNLFQDTTGVQMVGRVRNGPKNKQFVFDSKVNAYLHATGAGVNFKYLDDKGITGVDFGLRAEMSDSGLNVAFSPIDPIIAYRKFQINKDNYLFLGSDKKVKADIDMLADDGTGAKIYSTPNEEALQDITVSLLRLNLGELTSVIPYAPNITGFLNGDAHLIQTPTDLSVVVDMYANDMAYEKAPLGDISLNAVYLPNSDGTHFVDSRINHNENEVLVLSGSYKQEDEDGIIDAGMELIDFPLSLANGFISDGIAVLEGLANANLTVSGVIAKPVINGWLSTKDAKIKSPTYSLNLRLQDDSIKIDRSHLNFDKLLVYSTGKNPLVFDGTVNFADFEKILLNLRVNASNFELINAKRTQQASAYGKVYVDIAAMMTGNLSNNIDIRGRLGVLGNTDVTYVLKDSPLTVEDRLSDLVTFVDFSDTTKVKANQEVQPLNVNMSMSVNIDQGTQIHCLLSADRSKYIDLEGGGELTMNYSPQGELTLNGRYTVLSGEMKYSLPIIPLKTFTILSGSYVDFNGPILNPTLNIAATERVRTTITENDVPRSVNFDVGLSITQTLKNIGLEFTLEAPEDMTLQNELATMSAEQRGRLAVTMLATGMYLAEGNENGGFSTSNALNALLQSEINNIAGKALETIDLSVGVDQSTTAEGSSRTDYSFRFAKRFWGNRISIIIGGKVSSGEDVQNTGASLIDNISLEYRLDKSGTRYVTLFYDKNYESLMEGEVTEMGAGLVLRRKMTRLGELFIFRDKKKKVPQVKDKEQ